MKRRIVARRNNVFSTFHFHYFIISLFRYFNIQYSILLRLHRNQRHQHLFHGDTPVLESVLIV
jgi:hypothetical protein